MNKSAVATPPVVADREQQAGAFYEDLAHMVREFDGAVEPYRHLLRHELNSAPVNEFGRPQGITTSYEYARVYACGHYQREPVLRRLSNGVERVVLQCLACGDQYSVGVRKADYDTAALRPLDEDLARQARAAYGEFSQRLWGVYSEETDAYQVQRRTERSQEWWSRYSQYLQTEQWQDKRRRVLERDGYVCQACLKREATQVHHLTYERVFNEPLFDLASVCTTCHRNLHPHMEHSQ